MVSDPALRRHDPIHGGAVRFEDLLLVTDDGAKTLTRYSYDL